MADYDGAIKIGVIVDDKDAIKGLGKLEEHAEDIADGFDKSGKGAASFADVLKGNLLSNAIVSGVSGLAEGIKGLGSTLIESAANVKAERSQFEQTFGTLQDAAETAIERVADTSGVLETRLNTLGGRIYAFARASGGDTADSLNLMETALQAAADNAAHYDRSLEDSTETLQSFLKGNYENDAALGLSATETTRNAAAMSLFGQEFSKLSEIQKQQTLLQMVLDAQKVSGAMGQAAREADGWENVQGNLNETWRQFAANVGSPLLQNLIPIIQNITVSLQEWISSIDWAAFNENINSFVSAVMNNGPEIISTIAGVGAGFVAWNVVTMIQGLISAVSAFKAANDGLKISQIALNAVMNANPLALLATLIAGVVAAVVALWNTSEDFRNTWYNVWDGIKTTTKNVINNISASFEGMINTIIRGLNWLIKQANKIQISIPDWVPGLGGKTWGINIKPLQEVNLPRLAQGAVIPPNREFLAVLGDQKSGTNIEAPLETMVSAFRTALRDMNVGGQNGGTQTVVLELDGTKLGQAIFDLNRRESRRKGTSLLIY